MTLPRFWKNTLNSALDQIGTLTGDRDYIYELANKGFNLYAGENSKVNGGFEHSGLFVWLIKMEIYAAERMILETLFCIMTVW
jgi:hypothetical protein